jgi:NAD(P)-dependent dehydrogenase (short-subunit alcohol dehydrogenase family)
MRHDRQVALVTGANQGIGLEIARELAGHGYTVLVGSRDLARGEAAAATIDGDARAVELDVTNHASIGTAAARVADELGRLDVLIQNAAIASADRMRGGAVADQARSSRPSVVSIEEMRAVWDTNVFGVLAVYQAMLPLLRKTPGSRIVNLSSGLGSLSRASDPDHPNHKLFGPLYPASKTALNALTVAMAIELEPEGIKVSAVAPGFTRTNLNGYTGTETVEQGAREAVRAALLGRDGLTGTFTRWGGETIPW